MTYILILLGISYVIGAWFWWNFYFVDLPPTTKNWKRILEGTAIAIFWPLVVLYMFYESFKD